MSHNPHRIHKKLSVVKITGYSSTIGRYLGSVEEKFKGGYKIK